MDMLTIGSRSALFEYRVNQTTGKVTSKGAGPGGSSKGEARCGNRSIVILHHACTIRMYADTHAAVTITRKDQNEGAKLHHNFARCMPGGGRDKKRARDSGVDNCQYRYTVYRVLTLR